MAKKMTAAEIGNIGERYATAFLEGKGFTCYRNTQLPGSTDIEAVLKNSTGNVTKRILAQVKTAVTPNSPADLSLLEKSGIVSRANRNNAEAWLAQVSINDDGDLLGDIKWTKLN
jgi:hypothetical protein